MADSHVNEAGKFWMNVTWDDAPHLSEENKAMMMAAYPEFERDARTKGLPMMGSGSVFPISDDDISIEPFEIPGYWAWIQGCDFGIDHPAAGVRCAVDRETDTFYIVDCYRKSGQTAVYHANWFKTGDNFNIPVAWPKDGMERDKGGGVALKDQYRHHGAAMLRHWAAYRDKRDVSVEAGLTEMLEYMRTGKFKVFSHLREFFEEKRSYHRKDGQVVKIRDDIMAASRYAFVMRRMAATRAESMGTQQRQPMRSILA